VRETNKSLGNITAISNEISERRLTQETSKLSATDVNSQPQLHYQRTTLLEFLVCVLALKRHTCDSLTSSYFSNMVMKKWKPWCVSSVEHPGGISNLDTMSKTTLVRTHRHHVMSAASIDDQNDSRAAQKRSVINC